VPIGAVGSQEGAGKLPRERLDKGALPLDKALDLATEVGEALIAAHRHLRIDVAHDARHRGGPGHGNGGVHGSRGDQFHLHRPPHPRDLTPRINVILNWFEELKRRVPTGGSQ